MALKYGSRHQGRGIPRLFLGLLIAFTVDAMEAVGETQGASELRTIQFPEDHSLGWVLVQSQSILDGYIVKLPWIHGSWQQYSEALGTVEVPKDAIVKLQLAIGAGHLPEEFASLQADEFAALGMMYGNRGYARGGLVLANATKLTGLKAIEFVDPAMTLEDVERLKSFPNLEALHVISPGRSPEVTAALGQLTSLRTLAIQGELDPDSLSSLAEMPNLTAFYMSPRNPAAGVFEALARLPHLEHLAMHCSEINASHLKHIVDFPALRALTFNNAILVADEIRLLAKHPGIESLLIVHWLDDAGLEAVGEMPALRQLGLLGDSVGGSAHTFSAVGLKHLSECKTLETLYIGYGTVDDEGAIALAQMPRLKRWRIGGTSDDRAGTRSLAEKRVH